jgi:hypothetical protein
MKKKLLVLMLFFGLTQMAMAQKDSLAFDEHGKYIYYRVVNQGKDDAAVLYQRALDFTQKAYDASTLKPSLLDEKNTTIDGGGYFVVSKPSQLARHDNGRILYKLHIEIKGQKYRYWLTGFVFIPYIKDRYNNMVPQPGVEIPMEDISKKVEARDAAHYLDECAAFGKKLGAKLKQYMDAEPTVKTDNGKKVIDTKKW